MRAAQPAVGQTLLNLEDLIPRDKFDLARAQAAVTAGYPAVAPILERLMEWMQDYNWPVARVLEPLLRSVGAPIVPHIDRVLQSDDLVWKYWIIQSLVPSIPREAAVPLRAELSRLQHEHSDAERDELLHEAAAAAMWHFRWT